MVLSEGLFMAGFLEVLPLNLMDDVRTGGGKCLFAAYLSMSSHLTASL